MWRPGSCTTTSVRLEASAESSRLVLLISIGHQVDCRIVYTLQVFRRYTWKTRQRKTTVVQVRCYQDTCQCHASVCHNVPPDMIDITNMIVASTGYCLYLSRHGHGFIRTHVKIIHWTSLLGCSRWEQEPYLDVKAPIFSRETPPKRKVPKNNILLRDNLNVSWKLTY